MDQRGKCNSDMFGREIWVFTCLGSECCLNKIKSLKHHANICDTNA